MIAVRLDARIAARVDPSDVIQETLAVAHRQLSEYLPKRPLPFYLWLRRIACDRLADLHRRHFRAKRRSVGREELLALSDDSAMTLGQRLFSPETSHLGRLVRKEMLQQVRGALERLSVRDREVLILRHLEELGIRETASVLGISESAAKLRHLRAIERLQKLVRR
jgi:RNA polymerase sigma-70 factor, ECF subfamily